MLYFLPSYAYHGEGSSKGKIMLLSICMNVNTYFTKMVLLNSLNA